MHCCLEVLRHAEHERVERLGRVEAREPARPPLALVLPNGTRPARQRTGRSDGPADLVEKAGLVVGLQAEVEGDGVVHRVAQAPGLFRVQVPRAIGEEPAALVRSRRPTTHQAHCGIPRRIRFRPHEAVPEAQVVAPVAPLDHTVLRPRRPARAVLPGAWKLSADDESTARLPIGDDELAALDR